MADEMNAMGTDRNTQDTGLDEHDPSRPLAVPPRLACQLLSVGLTRLYELLNTGELDSFHIGRARRITTASIRAYIDRRLVTSAKSSAGSL
jgi:excisionase family DNA binding protein